MTVEPAPGQDPADRELQQQWRRQFDELPPAAVDARIRAAARSGAGKTRQLPATRPRTARRRWQRFTPLAAAASVALLAVGLVRLIPKDEYTAFPPPTPAQEARTTAPDAPAAVPAASAEPSAEASLEKSSARPAAADTQERSVPMFVPDQPPVAAIPLDEAPATERVIVPPAAGPAVELPHTEASTTSQSAAAAPVRENGTLSGLRAGGLLTGPTTSVKTTSERPASQEEAKAVVQPQPALIEALLADAARRTGLLVEALRVIEVTPMTWRDASLGCPAADGINEAAQAEVPGFIVTIDAAGSAFRYHTDQQLRFTSCD